MTGAPPGPRFPRWPAAGLAAILLLAGLVVSRPLVLEWRDSLPHSARSGGSRALVSRAPGDTLQLYYHLWLVRDGLLGPTPLFRDPYQFRVGVPRPNLSQAFLPLSLPFTLLSPLGLDAAYNVLVFLSFPLAGLAMFALARRHTPSLVAAAAAGLAYALFPARLGPLFGGHAAGFAAGLVPVALWGLDVALVDRRLGGGLLGGGAVLALAMIEPHYAVLTGILVAGYFVARWPVSRRPREVAWGPLIAFGLLAGAGAGWLELLRRAYLVGSVAEKGRSLGVVRLLSPGPAALALPETYGGVVVALLALAGLGWGRRQARRLRTFYGLALVLGVVMGLGPTLRWLRLYEVLHVTVPVVGLIRNPQKFRLLASVGGAALVALGTEALLARLPARAVKPVAALVLAAVLLETPPWHRISVNRFRDSPVYETMRAEAEKALYLPLFSGDSVWSSVYLYATTRTRVPMLNGYSPLVSEGYGRDVYERLRGLNVGHLGPGEEEALRSLGVSHVVVDRALFPPEASPLPSSFTVERLRASPALTVAHQVGPLWLFRVGPTGAAARPPPEPTSPVGIFYEAESLLSETGGPAGDPAASGGRVAAVRPGANRAGFLMFGPYRLLPGGRYRATFRVRGAGLTLEVTTDDGRTLLASRTVAPGPAFAEETLPFTLADAKLVEFRIRWDGRGPAAADWVVATFADRPQPETSFEVEALPNRLEDWADPDASGGQAGYAAPSLSHRRDVVSGPGRLYPPGRYRLGLRVRLETPVTGPVLRLAVGEPQGRGLASRVVDGPAAPLGQYGVVSLDFALDHPAVLEFPVTLLARTGAFLDRLDVVALTP